MEMANRVGLLRARHVVENAFVILANRLLTTIEHKPATVQLITTTCTMLHNLMRIRYPHLENRPLVMLVSH